MCPRSGRPRGIARPQARAASAGKAARADGGGESPWAIVARRGGCRRAAPRRDLLRAAAGRAPHFWLGSAPLGAIARSAQTLPWRLQRLPLAAWKPNPPKPRQACSRGFWLLPLGGLHPDRQICRAHVRGTARHEGMAARYAGYGLCRAAATLRQLLSGVPSWNSPHCRAVRLETMHMAPSSPRRRPRCPPRLSCSPL